MKENEPMPQHHLSKSNFKLASECKQKLKYYKAKYPSTLQDNELLEFLAEGGFMVEAIAHAVMLHTNPGAQFEQTFTHDRLSARVDGWERFATHAVLTEIKATSVETAGVEQFLKKDDSPKKEWLPYLLDITFQVMVARLANPGLEIRPRLCVVNKTKPSSVEAIYANIDLIEDKDADRNKPRAVFTGDRAALAADHFLEFIDVSVVVDHLMEDVKTAVNDFLDFLDGIQSDYTPERRPKECKHCEFRGADLSPNGFEECWGPWPADVAHFLSFYQGFRSKEGKAVFEEMLKSGNYRLVDLPESLVNSGKSYAPTRRNQVRAAREGKEVQNPQLVEVLGKVEYPIHFIDFEASRIPVPYRPGMRPYEQVAFQFSCHTLESPNSTELKHSQWLNLRDAYPNEEFVRELVKAIGFKGTVLTWSHYEKSTLKSVRRQLSERGALDAELAQWFDGLVGPQSPEGNEENATEKSSVEDKSSELRIFDLLDVSREFYCHPDMNGSHSIKRVLDSIWPNAEALWSHPWFSKYYKADSSGRPTDPYLTLVNGDDDLNLDETDDGDDEVQESSPGGKPVTDGVGAMRAYQAMLYGKRRGDEAHRTRLAEALYRYCALDTAAMVMIWKYWLRTP
jgi:hypothetical protein